MKNIIATAFVLLCIFKSYFAYSEDAAPYASTDLATLKVTNITAAIAAVADSKLKQCLLELQVSKGWTSIDQVHSINCNNQKISTLDGLAAFTALDELSLYNNHVTSLKCESFPQLKSLNLAKNDITSFYCSDHLKLETLIIFSSRLITLELNNLPNLQTLKANNNVIESFKYQSLPSIEKLYLFNNQLKDIDIYQLPALKYMDVRENPMPDKLYDEMDKLIGITVLHDGNAEDWD
jgi:Leucine-rich repeat (LRR) protein